MIKIHFINDGRYCSSKELHKLLGKKPTTYVKDVKKWLTKKYLFQEPKDKLSYPVANYDYMLLSREGGVETLVITDSQLYQPTSKDENFNVDFMLRLELVKLITVYSNSRVQEKFVQWLLSLDKKVENYELISTDLLFGLLELAKLCEYMDRQIQYYSEHKAFFQSQVEDNGYYQFDVWRNKILEIGNASTVRSQYKNIATIGNLITKREQENRIDPYKSVRNAMFDFLKMQYNQIDYFFPEATSKSLTLANITQQIIERVNGRPDIKHRGYDPKGQLDITRVETDADIELVNRLITKGIIESIN